jgi:hypothetical protein
MLDMWVIFVGILPVLVPVIREEMEALTCPQSALV